MRLPSSSELPRVFACLPSALLPRADSSSRYSDRGDVIHAFLHAIRRAGRTVALRDVPEEYRGFCESIDVGALPVGGDPEVAFAWDHVTGKGRRLGEGLNRDYSKALPTEFTGTADLVDVTGKTVKVDDYKSGFRFVPPDSWQMKSLCLYAARAHDCDDAEATIWKIGDDGKPRPYTARFDGFDLDSFADELVRLAKRLAEARDLENVTEGDHCRYCPAMLRCPAKTALVRAMPVEIDAAKSLDADGLTIERAARSYVLIQRYRQVLDAMEDRIKEMAAQSPIALPNGHTLKEVESSRESIDSTIAYAVITRDFGTEAATKAVEQKATKASIKRALNGGTKKALAAIEAEGGIAVKTTVSVKECE